MNSSMVAICAATYQRPKMLAKLLKSLSELNVDGLNVHLVIADNDAHESARETFNSFAHSLPFPSTYIIESTRGLASVRNRLVAEARAINAEFIAFIDDDETADPLWLSLLVRQIRQSNADAVAGLNIRWMDEDIPRSRRSCFQVSGEQSGQAITYFGTGNVLIRMKSLEQIDGPFDIRMNLTGGEDSMLASRFVKKGLKIVFCREAVTYEYIPRSRTAAKYILQRAFRAGTTRSKIVRWSNPSPSDYISHIGHSLGIIAKHSALMIPNAITRGDLLLFRVRCIVSGIGGIAGIITTRSYSHQEYATIHGE